jgi:hypothetical protein
MNTTTIDHTDANMMTVEQMEHFILELILAAEVNARAAKTKMLMDAMKNKTALRFYGQVCGLFAMAAAANEGSAPHFNTISGLEALIDIVAPLLEARGYVPQMQSGGGCY